MKRERDGGVLAGPQALTKWEAKAGGQPREGDEAEAVDKGRNDRACTGSPAAVEKLAKRLQIQQRSTNAEVVWIVATGYTPGIYMTAAEAKEQWNGFPGSRHCAMNKHQFQSGEHVAWYRANYGQSDCVIKPTRNRKQNRAADESTSEEDE